MASVHDVMNKLKAKAKPGQLEGMERYGMVREKRLGISIPDLRKMAKELGKDHELALKLWETGFQESRILASMIDHPDEVTEQQMEDWVKDINSWDVCDQVCMNLFEKIPFARKKLIEWSTREEEFVKRTAFSLIACLAWYDTQSPDKDFIQLLPIIKRGATDERNFVKKAVSWALRNIGKRNATLNNSALNTAREIHKMDSKVARWIASDVIRDLEGEPVQRRLKRKQEHKQ